MRTLLQLARAARPLALDLFSSLVFLLVISLSHDVVLATGAAVVSGLAQAAWMLLARQPIAPLQWFSLGLVVLLGATTLATHDARFIMLKPTAIYLALAAVMLRPGWMARYLPPIVLDRLGERSIVRWGYAWAVLMAATALANLAVALTMSPEAWAWFVAVVPTSSKVMLFLAQFFAIRGAVLRRAAPPSAMS